LARGDNSGHPFVDETNRAGFDLLGQLGRERPRGLGRGTFVAGQSAWQPDDYLDGLVLGYELGKPPQITFAAANRLDWGGEHAGRIRRRDTDSDAADVDSQARSDTHSEVFSAAPRTPAGVGGFALPDGLLHGSERLVDLGRVGAAALGDIVLAATSPAECLGGNPYELACFETPAASLVVGGDDNRGTSSRA
jgi:hypothetical protein